jgi:hypothetical protein
MRNLEDLITKGNNGESLIDVAIRKPTSEEEKAKRDQIRASVLATINDAIGQLTTKTLPEIKTQLETELKVKAQTDPKQNTQTSMILTIGEWTISISEWSHCHCQISKLQLIVEKEYYDYSAETKI